MNVRRLTDACLYVSLVASVVSLVHCGGPASAVAPPTVTTAAVPSSISTLGKARAVPATPTPTPSVHRNKFLGGFYRPEGAPPFGIFAAQSSNTQPQPYPVAAKPMTGTRGYCSQVASNGVSIQTGYPIDQTKYADLVGLHAKWTRMPVSQFNDDGSHIFGAGHYSFADLDSAQCATVVAHGIEPVIGLEAGPVEYDSTPGTFSPEEVPTYQTAGDFGQWCGAVAAHERTAFTSVTKFSLPGNEVNTNPGLFPGGLPQIAAYSEACYAAIKAANPSAFVYGFELNMDGQAGATAFVQQLRALGCGVGTCYDGISMHLALRYPIPPAGTPCYPNPGGDYGMQCVADIQTAANDPSMHVLISESAYYVPSSVPDEATKALAVTAAFKTFAANPTVDGVNYANIDECALYPSGYFSGGCLVSASGTKLPAYTALSTLAQQYYL